MQVVIQDRTLRLEAAAKEAFEHQIEQANQDLRSQKEELFFWFDGELEARDAQLRAAQAEFEQRRRELEAQLGERVEQCGALEATLGKQRETGEAEKRAVGARVDEAARTAQRLEEDVGAWRRAMQVRVQGLLEEAATGTAEEDGEGGEGAAAAAKAKFASYERELREHRERASMLQAERSEHTSRISELQEEATRLRKELERVQREADEERSRLQDEHARKTELLESDFRAQLEVMSVKLRQESDQRTLFAQERAQMAERATRAEQELQAVRIAQERFDTELKQAKESEEEAKRHLAEEQRRHWKASVAIERMQAELRYRHETEALTKRRSQSKDDEIRGLESKQSRAQATAQRQIATLEQQLFEATGELKAQKRRVTVLMEHVDRLTAQASELQRRYEEERRQREQLMAMLRTKGISTAGVIDETRAGSPIFTRMPMHPSVSSAYVEYGMGELDGYGETEGKSRLPPVDRRKGAGHKKSRRPVSATGRGRGRGRSRGRGSKRGRGRSRGRRKTRGGGARGYSQIHGRS